MRLRIIPLGLCRRQPRRTNQLLQTTVPILLKRGYHYDSSAAAFQRSSWPTAGRRFSSSSSESSSSVSFAKFNYKGLLGLTTLSAATLFGVQYFHDHFGGTEGLYRALSFYKLAIPKYILYRYHSYIQSPDHVWEELDKETSQQGLDIILQLRGFYIKCGQICAANFGDAFPEIWQKTMSVLQDQCPAEDFESVILPILRSELDYDAVFASFEQTPIGSASIGQVHRAVLKDGTPVVVKICYPHVERLLRGDVRTIRAFCEVAQPVHVPGIKEVEKQFVTEFDYRTESLNMELVRENLARAGLCGPNQLCVIPRPYRDLCTKRVLIMEELQGDKLVDALRQDIERWAKISGKSVRELMESQRAGLTFEEFEKYLGAVNAQRRVSNVWKAVYNWTAGWVAPNKDYRYISKADLPLNHAKLVDDLILIHGHQVLVDGRFNADCHPGKSFLSPAASYFAMYLCLKENVVLCIGNVLLCRTKDGAPQLGLIDYGMYFI